MHCVYVSLVKNLTSTNSLINLTVFYTNRTLAMKYFLLIMTLFCFANKTFAIEKKNQDVKVNILLQTDKAWNGQEYQHYPEGKPELIVEQIVIKPNSVLNWHQHPYPNAGKILAGSITVEDISGKKQTYVAGDAVSESVNNTHRGITGPKGATILVVYSGVKDIKPSIPVNIDPINIEHKP